MIVGFLMIVAPARPKYLPIRKQNTVQNHEKEIVRSTDLSMEWKGIELHSFRKQKTPAV